MIIPKRKKSKKLKYFAIAFLLPILGGIIGNIAIKSMIGTKSVEHALIDTVSNYDSPSEIYTKEAEAYKKEIETLKSDNERIRKELASRGDAKRIVEADKEQFQQNKVIKAIANNLHGAFKDKAPFIYNKSREYNVNPMLMASIMRHETGNGSSLMVVNNNNPGGISTNSGGFMKYKTLEDGITAMIKLLKAEYIDKGFTDIESIGKKYCPLSDKRDTKGLNKYWIPMVTANYIKILEESK